MHRKDTEQVPRYHTIYLQYQSSSSMECSFARNSTYAMAEKKHLMSNNTSNEKTFCHAWQAINISHVY